jgi:hypothetical protein
VKVFFKLTTTIFMAGAAMTCTLSFCLAQAFGGTTNLDFVAAAAAEDIGPQDGLFDAFGPSNLGSIDNNGFESFRTALEFDIAAIPAGMIIESATLTLNANVFEGTRNLEVNGYVGDGMVKLQDFSVDDPIGNEILPPGTSQNLVFDVTGFVNNLADNGDQFAGFNLRENPPSASNFTLFNIDMNGLDSPHLSITFEPVPEPSVACLMGFGSISLILRIRIEKWRSRRYRLWRVNI